jgi:hypothetical protein
MHTDAAFCCWGNQGVAFAIIHEQPFHFHIILESLTFEMWLQQPKKVLSQGVIFHNGNATPHSTHQAQRLLQLFHWKLIDHLDNCLCH